MWEVAEYVSLLTNFAVPVNVDNRWIWNFDPKKVYSEKGVYHILKYHNLHGEL